jgi:hypothetical protein
MSLHWNNIEKTDKERTQAAIHPGRRGELEIGVWQVSIQPKMSVPKTSKMISRIRICLNKLNEMQDEESRKGCIPDFEASLDALNTKFYGAQQDHTDADVWPKNQIRAKELVNSKLMQSIIVSMDSFSVNAQRRVESIVLFVLRRGFADDFFENTEENVVWKYILMNYANSSVGPVLRNIVAGLSKRDRMISVILRHDQLLDTLFNQVHNPEFDIQIQTMQTIKRVCKSRAACELLVERWDFLFPRLRRVCSDGSFEVKRMGLSLLITLFYGKHPGNREIMERSLCDPAFLVELMITFRTCQIKSV